MEIQLKLFRVEKRLIPEWGEAETEWVKYFLAHSEATVDSVVRDRYGVIGRLEHWYDYDRTEMKITITEIEDVEVL
jgi:hypothetical protein